MIVFGNCSVLAALIASKNRKTRMNFFIMHLAIADLMVGLINVLTDIVWRTTVGFYAGNIACKIVFQKLFFRLRFSGVHFSNSDRCKI
ncbi:cardioacceleratory peptide receptor-like protein [Leptotrombidium deliense]|uniref:Cardioacceleratory peptide receptor-like protein n=1 Tax=Leptotrombidium deliense TaxID=299467 RepID=A0A443RZQ6_9ACAR|nr:cardioacceleratory peptide receptor-like protein [Leptotrombidium deliense]